MSRLVPVPCPTCGPARATPWKRVSRWRVVRCLGCGLGITWPRPEQRDLDEYYGHGYYEERGMGDEAAGEWMERAAALVGLLPVRPRELLDVGAGGGHFVASLQRMGLAAQGVEPLPLGREAAQRVHGVSLLPTLPPVGAFDTVTLIHSLEHVPDPLATLMACKQRLAPGGWLLIEVPHVGSIEMLRPARRRHILNLPGHLYHFTPSSLTALLAKAGLRAAVVKLTNPDALEWLFARRAALKRRAPVRTTSAAGPPETSRPVKASGLRRLWRETLLPAVRSRWPGWSFAVVAQRSDSG